MLRTARQVFCCPFKVVIIMPVCYIIGAGDCEKIRIKKENDLIIAADGGLKYCERDSIKPDIVLGDFDSLGFVPECENVLVLPVEKDDTDTSFAVKYAMAKGYDTFVIYGGTGGKRADHTYANIALLAYISKHGGTGFLVCGEYTITSITDSEISFPDYMNGDISVFSFDTVSHGVTETGLYYNFDNADVENSIVTGVSNSFTGKKSSVSVKNGTLIIYYYGKFSDVTIDKL